MAIVSRFTLSICCAILLLGLAAGPALADSAKSEKPASKEASAKERSDRALEQERKAQAQRGQKLAKTALEHVGYPYRWGGTSPASGFDCSGFVMYVYAQVGVSLPHNAAAQYGYGTPVSRDDLQPGDLVFFDGLGHNGIYIGGGQFIHAAHTGDVVKISTLSQDWYAQKFVGARRL